MDPIVRYADVELHRPVADFFADLDRLAGRRAGDDGSGGATRVYQVGSPFWYRIWGAWATVRTFPLIISVAQSPRDHPTAARIRLGTNEGWYLVRLPVAFQHADRAFVYWIDAIRGVAASSTIDSGKKTTRG